MASIVYGAVQKFKALYLGDWLKSPAQLSTVVFGMSKMKGNVLDKMNDVVSGSSMMVSSYKEGSPENKFLIENAPEVYFRGLGTHDFVDGSQSENYMEGEKGFASELSKNSGRVFGVLKGLQKGIYITRKT